MASDVSAAPSPGSAAAVAFLMPEDVGALIRNAKLEPGKDYQIIDVRDDDFRVGTGKEKPCAPQRADGRPPGAPAA
ncbi:MAG: hypothetical protein BJ554DRAFT_6759 [Olpidium bornovanus]|uniref:Rhodanese domain-containing protein n=1 Tax=Olpidium bornovanus TaxID=278681 RepID=A0A8H7ZX15_9FUNG|nr:MAG: hypothetical protein BJ554DRAFT_6759 [Olpidium bornovanus]